MKDLLQLLDTFTRMIGKEIGHEKGQWRLDYASCYGGYVIEENMDNGGISHPFGSRRVNKSHMEYALRMLIEFKRG